MITHLLLGRRGTSRTAYCKETMAVLDGRGVGTNEGRVA